MVPLLKKCIENAPATFSSRELYPFECRIAHQQQSKRFKRLDARNTQCKVVEQIIKYVDVATLEVGIFQENTGNFFRYAWETLAKKANIPLRTFMRRVQELQKAQLIETKFINGKYLVIKRITENLLTALGHAKQYIYKQREHFKLVRKRQLKKLEIKQSRINQDRLHAVMKINQVKTNPVYKQKSNSPFKTPFKQTEPQKPKTNFSTAEHLSEETKRYLQDPAIREMYEKYHR